MRVSIVINNKAGSVNRELIEKKVRTALFRCDLRFAQTDTLDGLDTFLQNEVRGRTDYLMICGGDGTLNTVIRRLMTIGTIPPIVIVRSGTANDLACEMGISRRIDRAARAILEGEKSQIDLIEIEAGSDRSYMLTNGGLGIPAVTADYANELRSGLRQLKTRSIGKPLLESLTLFSESCVRRLGSGVYSVMLIEALRRWREDNWELEVDIPGRATFATRAPFILVNNQAGVGSRFKPAPLTKNNDGTVNILVTEAFTLKEQLTAILAVRSGTGDQLPLNRSYEVEEVVFRAKPNSRPLTFFGDGEILVKDVPELRVRCLKRVLPLVVRA